MTDVESEDLLQKITETTQEGYRQKIMDLYAIEVPAGEPPKRVMQKSYLTFATDKADRVANKRWLDAVSHEHKIHADIIDKLAKGERVEGIEEDPLTSNVENYETSVIPGTLLR